MNNTGSHKMQREVLCLRLQAQREQLALRFKRRAVTGGTPRSLTMRLLTRKSGLGLWILAEFLPVLLRHFFGGYNRNAVFVDADDDEDEETFLPRTRNSNRFTR